MRPDRILLIGMMGAGKTTIGRRLADPSGWRYYDNDTLVRVVAGVDTRRLKETAGTAAMRRAESAALTLALSEGGPLIAGVAAGIVTDPLDLQRLRSGGFVVWLKADLATLSARVAGTDRPWVGASPAAAMNELYAGREPLYRSAARLVIDTTAADPEQTARRIMAAFHAATPAK